MAALTRPGPLGTVDEAVRLLRAASAATLVCHAIGSVPFALSLLFAWSAVTDTHTSPVAWARQALLLTLLLVWMNCWRALYAGKLHAELTGGAASPWTFGRVAGLVASQAYFGASKMVVMPLAALVVFPWAEAVAIYRYLPILSVRADLDPRQMIARARHVAGIEQRLGWAILPILLFLQLAVSLNLAIVFALLPQIVRMLTGYEFSFSRGGIYFALNPLFPLLVLALSWIVFDPFVQAVYAVRFFQAESIETGEDLRCGLRRLRAPVAAIIALALFAAHAPRLSADVAPGELQKSIQRTMHAPEYDWRLPPAPSSGGTPWLVRVTDRLAASLRNVMRAIGRQIGRFLRWLSDRLRSAVPAGTPGAPPAISLTWIVAVLAAIALAAAGRIAWHKCRARPAIQAKPTDAGPVRLDAADLTADLLPEESWLALAERSLAEENFRFALRALYLASLAWLGRQELIAIHPGKTNHDYENELRRRARPALETRGLFAANVEAFERAWYGEHGVEAGDIALFRDRFGALKQALARSAGVAA
jgi:Domain of unknown function (DUF4129)